jgi:hypothetical protein
MSTYVVKLLRGLGWLFAPARRQPRHEPRCRVRGVETLEDRLALSGALPGPPVDAYVLAGQDSDPPGLIYRWGQLGGPGSHITLTYSYSNLLDGSLGGGLSPATIKAAIEEALSRWAAVAPIDFVEVPDSGPPPSATDYDPSGKPVIRFGDRPIDGPYNILGYGYYPGATGLAGDIQFDSSENWSVNPAQGIDLLEVAEHEIGHALGMAHEPAPAQGGVNAIMNPVYVGRFHGLGTSFLYQDDVNGIQALYGAGTGSVQTLAESSPPLPADKIQPYVASLYQLVLGRPASQPEIDYWVTINNQRGEKAVEKGIERSMEARTVLVRGWYQKFLGRAASAAEAQAWASAMDRGASEEQVMCTLLGSQEFYARAQTLFATGSGNERFVKALYQVTLNRAAGAGEVKAWLAVVQTRGLAVAARSMLATTEYRADAVWADYATFLGRTPSGAEVNGWATAPASLQAVREALLLSQEFLNRV